MIFAKHPTVLVNYKLRKKQKITLTHLKFMTFILASKTVVDETHMHKFPCRQVVYDDSGSPFSHPQITSHWTKESKLIENY